MPWDGSTPFDPIGSNIGQVNHLNPRAIRDRFERDPEGPYRTTSNPD
jgi:hypothetical protein